MTDVPDYLADWISTQRWFSGKSRAPRFSLIGGYGLSDETAAAVIRIYFVLDEASNPTLYQVPLTERNEPLMGAEAGTGEDGQALVATTETADGTRYIYDGVRDPAFAQALLHLIFDEGDARETTSLDAGNDGGQVVAQGHCAPTAMPARFRSSRVLGGEQSNTSIIYETADASGTSSAPVIVKLFRALHAGDNPDVILTEALGAAGSDVAPRSIGHITGRWPDTGLPGGIASGHLVFAQEFLPGVEDAWRVATRAASAGEDFTVQSRELGERTAQMHAALASALSSRVTTPADIAAILSSMRGRFDAAAAEIADLQPYRAAVEEIYRRAAESVWPALQRVHGDFHLGQVIKTPGRGWVILDFEGEPLRPMIERSQLDNPLRDVAGMLRSFDYVAGSLSVPEESTSGLRLEEWAAASRRAFLDGYGSRSGQDLNEHRAVLDACEIDKAVYEAIYETRNRPDWIGIPVGAIARLTERERQR